ncbi:uncharacterized protein LOC132732625 [Ruditapes philippinarum]|uniref:uncharacterized protein LOC132732625 n=1 Tax=Ruditapes philippinarum TaxID=129788 RepID=UPI00295B1064|nr:uncharacterized protein LOC132732625 [Ruditapes philippinarum]
MDVKKTKRPKWEMEETTVLVETVVSFKNLDAKFTNTYCSADRNRFWADTTEKINAVGGNSRTVQQVEKKWRDMKSQTKSKEVRRREEMRKTGGGAAEHINMSSLEEKILGKIPSCTVEGVPGGRDTSLILIDDTCGNDNTKDDDSDVMPSTSMTDESDTSQVKSKSRTDPETLVELHNEATEARESTSEQQGKEKPKKRPKGDIIPDFIREMEEKKINELKTISSTLSSIDNSLKELISFKKRMDEHAVDFLSFEV